MSDMLRLLNDLHLPVYFSGEHLRTFKEVSFLHKETHEHTSKSLNTLEYALFGNTSYYLIREWDRVTVEKISIVPFAEGISICTVFRGFFDDSSSFYEVPVQEFCDLIRSRLDRALTLSKLERGVSTNAY